MGFEAYTVVLAPAQATLPQADQANDAVLSLVSDLQREWPVICVDKSEECCPNSLAQREFCLVYETSQGLFQMLLTPSLGQVSVTARFAYCNPRSVYYPFLAVITWLMKNYKLNAFVMASDSIPDLTNPRDVESILIPSMDYNRCLWQADAGTTEEAVMRPSEAIRRFIQPNLLNVALA